MRCYKVLGKNGKPCNGGMGQWALPRSGRPGKWMPPLDEPIACRRGYHVCRKKDLAVWLGPTLWVCETRGPHLRCDNKVVATSARLIGRFPLWNERTARLFAADCAERVLPLFLKERPIDRRAMLAARQFAFGKITKGEMAAARAAAGAAARAAAGAAAWDAAWAAAWDAARAAAWDAAWDAARAATRDAARDAAWAALTDGARAAARAAAWDPARAASRDAARDAAWAASRDAARAAARDAAGAAARAAARDAERRWQTRRLFLYLDGRVNLPAIKAKAAADWKALHGKGVGRCT